MSTDRTSFTPPAGTVWSHSPEPSSRPNGSPTRSGQVSAPLPEAIGKYKVLRQLGQGAMGVVYLCSQPGLERPVAVKVMIAGRHASAEQISRFEREAWAAAQLAHPNVLQIYDVGHEGELHYFVMEYVDGWSLDQLIGRPVLTLERSLRLLYQVARALAAAHAQNIIHRDIKPSNILIHRSGQPKLADFGLAKSLNDSRNLSGSGDLIGTPRYMSPEQAVATPQEVDARTDLYSLGAVMYEMLTGRPPTDGPSVLSILRKLTDENPAPVRELNPALPEPVAAVCERAMAKDKEARFPSATAMAEALETCLIARGQFEPTVAEAIPEVGSGSKPAPGLRSRLGKSQRRWVVGVGLAASIALLCLSLAPRFRGQGEPTGDNLTETVPEEMLPSEPAAPDLRLRARPASRPKRAAAEPADLSSRALAQARQQLSGITTLSRTLTPRDRLKSIVDDMTAVLRTHPDNAEALFLRAQAHRRAGECLAAADDLKEYLRRHARSPDAILERLLANYQLYILYLGNLNDPLLRPLSIDRVREDTQFLAEMGSGPQKQMAEMIDALARQDYPAAGQMAEKGLASRFRAEDLPDVLMVEADALFHLAEAVYAQELATNEGADRDQKRARREQLARAANKALRLGLDADPHHVGLLFLNADRFQRLAAWDTSENEDRPTMMRRQRLHFDTAMDRLRNATPIGSDTSVARAVLLSNFGRENQALDRVKDALTTPGPALRYLQTFKAWLRLQAPPDGILTSDEVEHILLDFQPAFETPPEDFNSHFIRALVHLAAGQWEEARRDLRDCLRKLGKDKLPTAEQAYHTWFDRATVAMPKGLDARYLDASLEVLATLAVPEDLRIRLAQELLGHLNKNELVQQEGLKQDEVKSMQAWTYFRLAKAFAAKNERDNAYRNAELALNVRLADLKPKNFREDPNLSGWNDDKEFAALYKKFETP